MSLLILGIPRFSREDIKRIWNEFNWDVPFDFHFMVAEPGSLIEYISSQILPERRKGTTITIHRKTYREGIDEYARKKYDLLEATGDEYMNQQLKYANDASGRRVAKTLELLKDMGYRAGIALEPGISLENLTEDILETADRILLMGFSSGRGDQKYRKEVTQKIRRLRKQCPDIDIQVDGGINEETISETVQAGADNLIIGSYITDSHYPSTITIIKESVADLSG